MSEGNGSRSVTVNELKDKLNSLRWEMRAYMLALILGVFARSSLVPTKGALHYFSAQYVAGLFH